MKNETIAFMVAISSLFSAPGCMEPQSVVKEPKKEQTRIVSLEQILPKLRGELLTESEKRILTGEELNMWTFDKLKQEGILSDYSGLAPEIVDSFNDKIIENTNIREYYGLRNDYYVLKNPQKEKPNYDISSEARLDVLRFCLFSLETVQKMEQAFPTKWVRQDILESTVKKYVEANCHDLVGLEGEHLDTRIDKVSNRISGFVDRYFNATRKNIKKNPFKRYCIDYYKEDNQMPTDKESLKKLQPVAKIQQPYPFRPYTQYRTKCA